MTIAFGSNWDGDQEVYSVQADGSGLVQITNNEAHDSAPKWSPDGRRLAFISDLTRRPRLMVSEADGSNALMVPFDRQTFFDLVWSPTGRQVVLLIGHELIAVDLETGLGVDLTGGAGYELELPSFSPDGDRLVFAASVPVSGGRSEYRLFTVGVEGTGLDELSVPAGEPNWPDWHPLKDEILFEAVLQGEEVGLYVATFGGSTRRLGANPRVGGAIPSWSPDGTMIAYIKGEPGSSRPMDSLHAATSNEEVDETVLGAEVEGTSEIGIYRFYWAPDNRHIAYTTTTQPGWPRTVDIFVLDICEGKPRVIVEGVVTYPDLSWRPLPEP